MRGALRADRPENAAAGAAALAVAAADGGAAVTVELEPSVARDEVHRLLGYGRRGAPRSERVARRLDELWPEATALLRPRGAWRLVTGARAVASTGMPRSPAVLVGLGVCTIGAGLEQEATRRSVAGALLDALLLDAFGSAATEAAADALNRLLCHEAHRLGLRAAARRSPGFGRWDVVCQARLLALLPAAELGLVLSPAGMMIPRKSVTFAVPLRFPRAGAGAAGPASGGGRRRRCRRCAAAGCL
ncbi:MAG: hypothetical protein FJ125_08485, partial [Deltaproteobacteria bacterium]|nr:hypothetical protein [Deltaproteobacteria bacterium]